MGTEDNSRCYLNRNTVERDRLKRNLLLPYDELLFWFAAKDSMKSSSNQTINRKCECKLENDAQCNPKPDGFKVQKHDFTSDPPKYFRACYM